MCGIAGILSKSTIELPSVLGNMNDALKHRGPDGHGTHIHKHIGIGHRRLSLIDLEGGKQPMTNEDGTVWIVFNGELYNFKELRNELEKAGHRFQTRSDTEVIVHAYEQWGKDCVKRFRGMFAFCILDQNKQQLFLARDHFGIKPLYYTLGEGMFAFASELQSFKAVPEFKAELDLSAIDKYLWLQYIPAPQTVFKNTYKLKPGHTITVDFEGKAASQEEYWDIAFKPEYDKSEAYFEEALASTIQESVKAHLVADVPFGAFLSGGLDSSVVVSYMCEQLQRPVKTFSIGFEEDAFSELPYAQQVADKWQTEHHVKIVRPDALAILPELVKHYGEPFGDSSAVPTYYVSQLASEHVKMVLSGDGGDEALAGYKTYSNWQKYELVGGESKVKSMLYDQASKIMPSRFKPRHSLEKWLTYIHYIDTDWRKKLWRPEYQYVVNEKLVEFEAFYRRTESFDFTQRHQYMDLKTYMPCDILTKVDVASMMHSLEVRTPLIDLKVWELAARIPPQYNMKKDGDLYSGKHLLKKALEQHFPHEFVHRKKMGFAIPIADWFGVGNRTGEEIHEMLTAPDAQLSKYFSEDGIKQLLQTDNYGGVWLLLFLEYWLRDFNSKD
jgi:asparagine synthase (glutamine-hydrolysing)